MNEISRTPKLRPTTQAAEGIPRIKWTLEEFERLAELGFFSDIEHVELIGGELVPMNAKGNRHELVRSELHDWMIRRLPGDVREEVELGWRPGGDLYFEPDILLRPQGTPVSAVPASEVLLLIEVADKSRRYDLGRKAKIYAGLGVREYWVVDAVTLDTRVHREPGAAGYASIADVPAARILTPLLVPALAVKLEDLQIG